tara:strand:+ start:25 stop:759 length:735 start_codon:yes stop_codon:yes gene_type:complete
MKLLLLIFFFPLISSTLDSSDKKRSYLGNWPINVKIEKTLPNMNITCPGEIGCECENNFECENNNCEKLPRNMYCIPKYGDSFPNFKAVDQYGEIVSIYDFSKQGKYILLEMGATWCSPCHLLANWLTYNDQEISNKRFWKDEYQLIYDLVHNDEIYFITILYEDDNRNNATYDTLYDWFSMYPDEKIPILADSEKFLHTWIKPTGLPAILLLDEDLKIQTFSSRGINKAFDEVINIYTKTNEE